MAEKVAILLIQLGEDVTTNIFAHLDVESITEISKFIAMAKTIDKPVAMAILEEFHAIMQSNQYLRLQLPFQNQAAAARRLHR